MCFTWVGGPTLPTQCKEYPDTARILSTHPRASLELRRWPLRGVVTLAWIEWPSSRNVGHQIHDECDQKDEDEHHALVNIHSKQMTLEIHRFALVD